MRVSILAITLAAAVAVAGCSTIVSGQEQALQINSNVSGADVLLNGVLVGKTPFSGQVKKSATASVTVRKDGFKERTVQLATEVEGSFWGNIIIGGLPGSSTDYGTGAMYKYAPNVIQVDLEPAAGK
ncbi:MAG: PEGA domain-containing protein [Burkholderiales bacterium]